MKNCFPYFLLLVFLSSCQPGEIPLYNSDAFSVYPNRVVQGAFTAKAISDQYMISNYESPANAYQNANISFKFSINGKDNEMFPGTDHHICVKPGDSIPVISFGKQLNAPIEEGVFLNGETPFHLKLDLREVKNQFDTKGFYENVKHEKIYKEDFKAVYVAGNTLPMTWDFDNLKNRPELELKDPDGDGIYETTLILNSKNDLKKIDTAWHLSRDISAFPQYKSSHVLANAIYNMSLEEMEKAIERDSTLRTGAEWAGVWTRDVSYSTILSMAYMQPKAAMNSLRRKVNKRKRIIQDTGTGGAWPVSTDRMIWAVAAWEIYLATGDENWLKEAFEVIQNSLYDDYKVCYDPVTGLVKGESSFLDWREQTYPKWMQPADIFESECLGTNAAHYQANKIASDMARKLNRQQESLGFKEMAIKMKDGINNHLWNSKKGYYGQYLYGGIHKTLSERSEALGEALSVIFDIADTARQQQVLASGPVTDFGIPCIFPNIPGIPPYHNNGIWPFVQTYWLWAGAKVGNETSVMESIAAIYRPSALFLTNKENFVAQNGDFSGTVINSSNMLWSLSGNISLVHKVLFGIKFTEKGLVFQPFVPAALGGNRSLTNFRYREALLNIELEGYGDQVASVMLDGKRIESPLLIPVNMTGPHNIKMVLNQKFTKPNKTNKVENVFTPPNPIVGFDNAGSTRNQLTWQTIAEAEDYSLFKDGNLVGIIKENKYQIQENQFGTFQVMANGKNGTQSFLSNPVFYYESKGMVRVQAEEVVAKSGAPYKGFEGSGFVEISLQRNRDLMFDVNVPEAGNYFVRIKYSNGNGPINTENKCAIRSLYADHTFLGSMVFPQRGTGEWSDWGYSNGYKINLSSGKHLIQLKMEDWNENMNGETNQAMIDFLEIQKM